MADAAAAAAAAPAPSSADDDGAQTAAAVLDAARRASALLSGSDAAARRRWAALPDEALAREVEACRREIRALTAALTVVAASGAAASGAATAGSGGGGGGGGGAGGGLLGATTTAGQGSLMATRHGAPAAAASQRDESAAAIIAAAAACRDAPDQQHRNDPDDRDDANADDNSEWHVPAHCIPIHANVTTFDWARLASAAQFDVVMMDPPWQLATANPTRGVALGYSQLADADITALPVPSLQRRGGFLFVWVINAKYKFTLDLFDAWGYTLVDEIVWVKTTVNRRLAKSHGYYLQHAKETCLVAFKGAAAAAATAAATAAAAAAAAAASPAERSRSIPGGGPVVIDPDRSAADRGSTEEDAAAAEADAPPRSPPPMPWELAVASRLRKAAAGGVVGSDVIFSERRGQSQKPEEVYELIEALVPNGRYLELFARKNNLRDFWTSIGNEVTGTGLPPEDMAAVAAGQVPEGAVYGRAPG